MSEVISSKNCKGASLKIYQLLYLMDAMMQAAG
jgi:hypothetical protein